MSSVPRNASETDFIAFDLETTGLSAVADGIVEIGAVRFRSDGTVLEQFQQLVNPERTIPGRVIGIHGITNEMVNDQPTIRNVLPDFLSFLGSTPAILMAHNARFDLGFVSVALTRLQLPQLTWPVIDTCRLAQRRLAIRDYRLETIGQYLGLIEVEEHRALADAELAKDVFLHLLHQPPAITDTDQLLQMAGHSNRRPTSEPVTAPLPGHEQLWEAISHQHILAIEYLGGSRPGAVREITPKAVTRVRGRLYVAAYCHRSAAERTFRLDRIRAYRRVP